MEPTDSFGYWLRRRRKALDLTQVELAQQVGCSVDLIQKIEADARRPSRQIAERLAECLAIESPTERVAFVQAARAEQSVGRLPPPAQTPLTPGNGLSVLPPREPAFADLPSGASNGATSPLSINPYKGLHAFREADAPDFFGRTALIQQLLERMAEAEPQARFLAVVGPSGSGKSSVVHAGLIPALRQGALPNSAQWVVAEIVPGSHPFEELEAALLRVAMNPPSSLLEQLTVDARGLARAVKRVLPDDRATELLLVIDQFEELFTLTTDEATRAAVLAGLVAALSDPNTRLRVVITLRADFYDRPLRYIDFGALLHERTEVVLPLRPEELERVIVGPAERVGLTVTPELLAVILQDVGTQPAILPLLQCALTELFERREGDTLTLAAYEASGGVHGALALRADALYAALSPAGRAAARQVFLRLVTLGEGVEDTRRRVLLSELTGLAGDSAEPDIAASEPAPELVAVLEAYDRARLLVFDRDSFTGGPTVELAHEALLREWDLLRSWLAAARDDVRMQRALAGAAAEWANWREPSYLLAGARLAQIEGWAAQTDLALTGEERAYLAASINERERSEQAEGERQQRELAQALALVEERSRAARRLRLRAILLACALIIASVAAVTAAGFARTARRSFTRSESLRLATEANAALERGESGDLPALLALRSLQHESLPQGFTALRQSLATPFPIRRFSGHGNAVEAVAFASDGARMLTGSSDGMAYLWDVASGAELMRFTGHSGTVTSVSLSPDGTRALTGGSDKTARLWDVATGQELHLLKGHFDEVGAVAFMPDGATAVTGGQDYSVRLWDTATGAQVQLLPVLTAVQGLAVSPDGNRIALAAGGMAKIGGSTQIWDLRSRPYKITYFFGHLDSVTDVAFTPDGSQLISTGVDQTIRIWDAWTGAELRRIEGHSDAVTGAAVSTDGAYLLTGSRDRTARLWELATGRQLRVYSGHTGAVLDVAFAPDGQQLLTGSSDTTAWLWGTHSTVEPISLIGHTQAVRAVAIAPDGRQVLTGSDDATARLWEAATGRQVHALRGHHVEIVGVTFTPDGSHALTAAGSLSAPEPMALRLWDVTVGSLVRGFPSMSATGPVVFTADGGRIIDVPQLAVNPSAEAAIGFTIWDVAAGLAERWTDPGIGTVFALNSDNTQVVVAPSAEEYFATARADRVALLYDLATGELVQEFRGHTASVLALAFSPDGRYVLTGGAAADPTVRLWDAATGEQIRVFSGHSNSVQSVAFAPDGTQIVTGSLDGTARLWDVATGVEVQVLRGHAGPVHAVAFAPDGSAVLTGSADKTARLWRLDDADLIDIACAALSRDFTADERTRFSIADAAPTCAHQ